MAKDLLKLQRAPELNLRTLLRPAVFVPESKGLNDLLRDFRSNRNHLAIVIDEFGNTAGLITIEDVLEEIVGEIEDEFDEQGRRVEHLHAGRRHASASPATPTIDAVNEAFGVQLPDGRRSTPSAAWSRTSMGRVPRRGEAVDGRRPGLRRDADARRRGALVQGVAAPPRAALERPTALDRRARRSRAPWLRRALGCWLALRSAPLQTCAFVAHRVLAAAARCASPCWRGGVGARHAARARRCSAGPSASAGSAPARGGCSSACTATAACRRRWRRWPCWRWPRALSLYFAAAMALFARWRAARGWRDALLFAAAVAAGRTGARRAASPAFPGWRAAMRTSTAPLAALAPWLGVYGIGARRGLAGGAGAALRAAARAPLAGALRRSALLGAGGAACGRARRLQPAGAARLSVTLLQGNVPQDEKFVDAAACRRRWPGTADAAAPGARRSSWSAPETAIPLLPRASWRRGYWQALLDALRRAAAAALVGMPLGDYERGYTNSVVGLSRDTAGAPALYRYDKHHLVPFGEFIPRGFRWFTEMMNIPLGDFNRGAAGRAVVRVRRASAWRPTSATRTCSARSWPRASPTRRRRRRSSPTSATSAGSATPSRSTSTCRSRACARWSSQRPMLRATNTGATAVIDHRGRVTHALPPFTRGVLDGDGRGPQRHHAVRALGRRAGAVAAVAARRSLLVLLRALARAAKIGASPRRRARKIAGLPVAPAPRC